MFPLFLAFVVLGFVFFFISKGIIIIRQAEVVIIERFGKYKTTLTSGLNFMIPMVDSIRPIVWKYVITRPDGKNTYISQVTSRIDLRETVYDFPRQNVITRDNVTIEINALLYFQIVDSYKATYEINNLPDALEKLTQTTLRNVIGELDLDQTLVSRDTVNSKLRLILDEATDKWGVKVNRVELQDVLPPKEIREAMEKQMRAERDKRATILTAEADKQSNILQAEGIRDSEISKAEGMKRSKILEAEGAAEARLKVIEAEALAIEKISKVIGGDPKDPINYLVAVKYIETLKGIAEGQNNKLVFMPYESSALVNTVGTIKELLNPSNKINSEY
jgi:regulator of protease activity HflC (stomatin/prohibitin superfamily)